MFVSGITETGHLSDGQCGQEVRMLCEALTFVKVQLQCVSVQKNKGEFILEPKISGPSPGNTNSDYPKYHASVCHEVFIAKEQ